MLKDIRLHIEQDEEKQSSLEEKLAIHITRTQKDNINAFQRFMPSILNFFKPNTSQNISIACNKFGEINIIDFGTGRMLYGFHPQRDVVNQVEKYLSQSLYVDISSVPSNGIVFPNEGKQSYAEYIEAISSHSRVYSSNKESSQVMVVLGLGLGFHINELINKTNLKHIIVYEPELQYFNCSVMAISWKEILKKAKNKGVSIYLQLGKDGRDLIRDIDELLQCFQFSEFYLYRHYNNVMFNEILEKCLNYPWGKVKEIGFSLSGTEAPEKYCPIFTESIQGEGFEEAKKSHQLFVKNIFALEKYFPDVYEEFFQYRPVNWLTVLNRKGQVNLLNKKALVSWYGKSPVLECNLHADGFIKYPNKDGLVLGYHGEKLKHYLHNQLIDANEKIVKGISQEEGTLPKNIKSMILFGLGACYQLNYIRENHNIEKLFICEPNKDFFYASLFSVDWATLLEEIDEKKGRVYINIGDDGTNLLRDLMNQFYAIGPYHLTNTYFYRGYYNPYHNQALANIREQLRMVVAIGEYFDHAYYGINHTKEGIRKRYPCLINNASKILSQHEKELPVFIVGNGPSLDMSIEVIRKSRDDVIIISCGTALQSLYKNGICPDFHAEIEQNRATYDWSIRLDDVEYLKKISLLSCCGIHPDTAKLFKDVFLAFKAGESSTVSCFKALPDDFYQALEYAFPTVGNFALNILSKLGFKQIYLLGIDLGFTNREHHHSIKSGYYSCKGKALYDYSANENTSLKVPGNLRPVVFTKYEFRLSRTVMEDTLRRYSGDCYNTSDGAKIEGTIPLKIEDVLILPEVVKKNNVVSLVKKKCFSVEGFESFESKYDFIFDKEKMLKQLVMFRDNASECFFSFEEVERFIDVQKNALLSSYEGGGSYLFYYLYGTVNYVNATLSKILNCNSNDRLTLLNESRGEWLDSLRGIYRLLEDDVEYFDASSSFEHARSRVICKHNKDIVKYYAFDDLTFESLKRIVNYYRISEDVEVNKGCSLTSFDDFSCLVFPPGNLLKDVLENVNANGSRPLIILNDAAMINEVINSGLRVFLATGSYSCFEQPVSCNLQYSIYHSFRNKLASTPIFAVLPKHYVLDESELAGVYDVEVFSKKENVFFYDANRVVIISEEKLDGDSLITSDGTRMKRIYAPLELKHFVFKKIDEQEKLEMRDRIRKVVAGGKINV